MKYIDFEYSFSQQRLNRYLYACGNSKLRAKKLYRANLKLAQSFYPILNLFEVVIRNRMHYQLSSHFTNPDWIIAEKNGFMNDPSLQPDTYLRRCVLSTENKIRRGRGLVTTGKLISEQTFGFWASLFDVHHYRLIGGCMIQCFPRKPAPINRSSISLKLSRIKEFRNRIYHNEPICFSGNAINLSDANQVKTDIYDLIGWIDPKLTTYFQSFDNIGDKIANALAI
jgi:hypothetical protein